MVKLACKKNTFFRRSPSSCFLQENNCVEFCEIFKGTYFEEHLRAAASENVFM